MEERESKLTMGRLVIAVVLWLAVMAGALVPACCSDGEHGLTGADFAAPAPSDFAARPCDAWPACGAEAFPDYVFPDLAAAPDAN